MNMAIIRDPLKTLQAWTPAHIRLSMHYYPTGIDLTLYNTISEKTERVRGVCLDYPETLAEKLNEGIKRSLMSELEIQDAEG